MNERRHQQQGTVGAEGRGTVRQQVPHQHRAQTQVAVRGIEGGVGTAAARAGRSPSGADASDSSPMQQTKTRPPKGLLTLPPNSRRSSRGLPRATRTNIVSGLAAFLEQPMRTLALKKPSCKSVLLAHATGGATNGDDVRVKLFTPVDVPGGLIVTASDSSSMVAVPTCSVACGTDDFVVCAEPAAGSAVAPTPATSGERKSPPPGCIISPTHGTRSTVYVNNLIHCVVGESVQLRTLQDLVRMGTAHVTATEEDTPAMAPRQPPVSVLQDLQAEGFSLDAIATPNTFRLSNEAGAEAVPPLITAHDFFHLLLHDYDIATETFHWKATPQGRDAFVEQLTQTVNGLMDVLESEPVFAQVQAPVYVFGDIHGNFTDLQYFLQSLLILEDIHITPCNVLCLGDYVDRGPNSLECVALLMALKLDAPHKVTLLRGNHEDRVVCGDRGTYGSESFLAQCQSIFGPVQGMSVFRIVTEVFRQLPLAAEIHTCSASGEPSKVLCTHGGIPRFGTCDPLMDDKLAFLKSGAFPRLLTLFPNNPLVKGETEFATSSIPKDVLERAWYVAFDLMWSDPTIDDSEATSDPFGYFGCNSRGGNVVSFSAKAVDAFLTAHGYSMLFRAHQEKAHGIRISKSSKVLTIFTSSNYLGHGNGGACAIIDGKGEVNLVIKQHTD